MSQQLNKPDETAQAQPITNGQIAKIIAKIIAILIIVIMSWIYLFYYLDKLDHQEKKWYHDALMVPVSIVCFISAMSFIRGMGGTAGRTAGL